MNNVDFISFRTQADTTSEMTSSKVDNDLSVPPLGNDTNIKICFTLVLIGYSILLPKLVNQHLLWQGLPQAIHIINDVWLGLEFTFDFRLSLGLGLGMMFGLEVESGIRFVEEMDCKPIDPFVSVYACFFSQSLG